jgi:hypothetical protein
MRCSGTTILIEGELAMLAAQLAAIRKLRKK